MGEKRTAKSKFPSRYNGGHVTGAQYLTECLCVLIARREKTELFDQFWNKEPWKAIFRRQVPLAVKLLKKHPVEVILATLRDRRCWKINSFGANWLLKPLLTQKQRELDAKIAMQSEAIVLAETSTVQKPRRVSRNKKSMFAKLKEIK